MHLVVMLLVHTVTQTEDQGWLLRLVLIAWLQWPGCLVPYSRLTEAVVACVGAV